MNAVQQLLFRDRASVASNRLSFSISQASASTQVWDITDPVTPLKMPGKLSGTEYNFINTGIGLREYVAFQ